MRSLLTLCLIATGAATGATAESLLTADAFDALSLGRTMTWAEQGQIYGVERYLPDRRVRWTELGDDCKLGHWYPEGDAICFLYEDNPTPACWEIALSGGGFLARDTEDPAGAELVTIEETSADMPCLGPEVGT